MACVLMLAALSCLIHVANANMWLNHGADLFNTRSAAGEMLISPDTAPNLHPRWKFFAGKDISATPAVANGFVYFPSWNGNIYALNAFTGSLIWQRNLGQLTGLTGTGIIVNVTVSRATPTVSGIMLVVSIYGPAVVIALDRFTGRLIWQTTIDPRPFTTVTASGTTFFGSYYTGVASLENIRTTPPCCVFRGSMVRLSLRTGELIWQTFTLPDNGGRYGGYSGASVWGSSPSIDPMRRLVYFGTGNLYSAPLAVEQCQQRQSNQTTKPTQPDSCVSPDALFDSLIAVEIDSGRIRWARQLTPYDVFYFACLTPNNPDCPPGPNLDADFGEAPMLLSVPLNGVMRDILVAVQKSGFAWALDRDNGDILWSRKAGPGGLEGGGTWGAATDGERVYTNIVNSYRVNFTLAPSNKVTTAGGWVGLNSSTGEILWTTANPSNETSNGPVSVVNGLVIAGSVASNGPVYAMDARTGEILWSYNTGATVYGGASAAYGCLYIGNGYKVSLGAFHPTWTAGGYLYAFCVV
ncbi:hypothetical protein MLD38_002417 [Melastoma candidum]|uniref:Uncharacterized protein n=1 Tax=Melastoma candidum TaxID=119954 RepID=A0ACB9S178_9MYRT|nr:hypothetical protein MLD38_002417 [Melastoma candidum]